MQRPIVIAEGIIIDARVVLVCLSGYFGGPLAAVISGVSVSVYRTFIGGVGTIAGIFSVLLSASVGCVFFLIRNRFKSENRVLLLMGFLLAVASLLSSFVLPVAYIFNALRVFSVPVLVMYPLGVFVFGKVIVSSQNKYQMEKDLVQLNTELERQVEVRTAEVEEVNKGLMEEIKMRCATEEDLKEAEQMATSANRMKSDFIANMSHEIRTPLNAIIGYTHLLTKTELSEKQRNYLAKMDSSSANLLSIVNDILDFSKIEAGKIDFVIAPVNLYRMLNKLMDTVSYELLQKELYLKLEIKETVPEWLLADASHLNQILLNILSNAVKFTKRGGVNMNVDLVGDHNNRMIQVIIKDTGIGVKEEQLDAIFQSFTQANMSINREFGGTGLGLAITRKLIEAMGGGIRFESSYGEGSEVTVMLPYEKSHQMVRHFDSMMNIAILTNKMETYRLLYNQLAKMGATIRTASTIDQLHIEDHFDYVLVDWDQKLSDHDTLVRMLEERVKPGTPIDLMTYERNGLIQAYVESHDENKVLYLPFSSEGIIKYVGAKGVNTHGYTLEQQYHMNSIRSKKILVVEDNGLNQDIERSILEEKGAVVTIAPDGKEAVEHVNREAFDLILMDIHMPVMGGYEAAMTIRQMSNGHKVPIIAMTADVQVEVKGRVMDAGMNDYIKKPIDVMEVYKVLSKYL